MVPSPVFLARLEALDELAREMRSTFRSEEYARRWLVREVPSLEEQRPIDPILDGKVETLTGMLYALNSGMPL